MPSPYNIEIENNCTTCGRSADRQFCNMSPAAMKTLDAIKFTSLYPKGSILFVEGEEPRGVFVLCSGRAKLTTSSSEGRTLIVKLAEPGEVLGASATILGRPYEVSAETLEPSQLNFVKRDDFLRFLNAHADACMHTAQQLSEKYPRARDPFARPCPVDFPEARKLLLDGAPCTRGHRDSKQIKCCITNRVAECRTTRETVTRLRASSDGEHIELRAAIDLSKPTCKPSSQSETWTQHIPRPSARARRSAKAYRATGVRRHDGRLPRRVFPTSRRRALGSDHPHPLRQPPGRRILHGRINFSDAHGAARSRTPRRPLEQPHRDRRTFQNAKKFARSSPPRLTGEISALRRTVTAEDQRMDRLMLAESTAGRAPRSASTRVEPRAFASADSCALLPSCSASPRIRTSVACRMRILPHGSAQPRLCLLVARGLETLGVGHRGRLAGGGGGDWSGGGVVDEAREPSIHPPVNLPPPSHQRHEDERTQQICRRGTERTQLCAFRSTRGGLMRGG